MRIRITFNLSDRHREAVGAVIEKDRKATYDEMREYIVAEVEDGLMHACSWRGARKADALDDEGVKHG